jgi:hypothetical protein
MVVTGYDDRHGCGYVVTTGADMPRADGPGGRFLRQGSRHREKRNHGQQGRARAHRQFLPLR